MDVTFAQHDVVRTAHFNLVPVLGAEQHPVSHFGSTNVRAERDHLGPHQSLGDLGRGGNQNATRGPTLTLILWNADQHPVIEHLDRQLLVGFRHALHGTVQVMLRETVSLQTLDGVTLEGDLVRTDVATARATVVIGHPHPLYGGDRHNHVVHALQEAAGELGCHSLACDFRGVGNSDGTHDEGNSERLDIAAACEFAQYAAPDLPIVIAGYSFGAAVALNVVHPQAIGWLAVAPPMAMISHLPTSARHHLPKVIIHPEHDQFCPGDALVDLVRTWDNTECHMLSSVDHFISFGAREACVDALGHLLDR